MFRGLWLICMLSYLFVGCSPYCRYECPVVDMPCTWQGFQTPSMGRESPGCFLWWKSLNDAQLDCLIERAAIQNLDLCIAMTRVLEARTVQKSGQNPLFPYLDGSLTCGHLHYNQNSVRHLLDLSKKHGSQRDVNFFEVGFDAEWEIDLFGKNAHEWQALQAKAEAIQEEFCDVWVTLSAEIARTYIELRGLQLRLELIKKGIHAHKDSLALTQGLIKVGLTGDLDQVEIEERLNTLAAEKPHVELAIHKAIHRLSILLGYAPGDLYTELCTSSALPALPCRQPIGVPSELLRLRPDIRKAERELAAATEQEASAIAALFPRLSLRGFLGDITTFCSGGGFTWFAAPQLLAPIFKSRSLKEDVCVNKIRVQQAIYRYQKTVLEALEEAENAIASFHYELDRKNHLEKNRNMKLEAYQWISQLYDKGLKSYLEVLEAERSVMTAEMVCLQCQVDLVTHYISLYKALGGGWRG